MAAPRHARETITSFLGDVAFAATGASTGPLARNGPALAAEYVRRATVAELRPDRADVVVAASHFLPDAAAVHAARRTGAHGVAFVYHLVANRRDRTLRTQWSRLDEATSLRLLRNAAGTVFTSNAATLAELRDRGFRPTRTDVGLDVRSFRRGEPDHAAPTILFLARIVPKKGLLDLVEALPTVLHAVPAARVVVAGVGPHRSTVERRAAALGVAAALDWRGYVTEDEKRELLATCRLLAAPSYEEGWGISVAEAMASRLPVVAYSLPTLDEVFGNGYCGVTPGATDELARAIVAVLRDDGEARRLADAGVAAVAHYDLDAVAERELREIVRQIGRA